jgi:hypothetical protein
MRKRWRVIITPQTSVDLVVIETGIEVVTAARIYSNYEAQFYYRNYEPKQFIFFRGCFPCVVRPLPPQQNVIVFARVGDNLVG